jgi:hypothetical protein
MNEAFQAKYRDHSDIIDFDNILGFDTQVTRLADLVEGKSSGSRMLWPIITDDSQTPTIMLENLSSIISATRVVPPLPIVLTPESSLLYSPLPHLFSLPPSRLSIRGVSYSLHRFCFK